MSAAAKSPADLYQFINCAFEIKTYDFSDWGSACQATFANDNTYFNTTIGGYAMLLRAHGAGKR